MQHQHNSEDTVPAVLAGGTEVPYDTSSLGPLKEDLQNECGGTSVSMSRRSFFKALSIGALIAILFVLFPIPVKAFVTWLFRKPLWNFVSYRFKFVAVLPPNATFRIRRITAEEAII
jgi:hypothetical protein